MVVVTSDIMLNLGMEKVEQDELWKDQDGIRLFKSAYNKLSELLKQTPNGEKLRITLEQTGCAGVSYVAKMDQVKPEDRVIVFNDVVQIIVSARPRFPSKEVEGKIYSDWDFLEGLELKYQESIMSSSFEMDNPNAERGCSCGISFRPKDYAGKGVKCN